MKNQVVHYKHVDIFHICGVGTKRGQRSVQVFIARILFQKRCYPDEVSNRKTEGIKRRSQ